MRVMPRSAISGSAAASSPRATARSTAVRSVGGADGARSGGLREVAVAEAQHDRAAHPVAVAQAPGEPVDDLSEEEVEFFGRARAAAERALGADGSAAPRGVDRAWIPQPGQRVQVRAGRPAQQSLGGRGFELGQLPDGVDAEPVQLLGGHGADPPQPFDRQREQELLFPLGFDDEQPVGFADGARDLGEELGPRDSHRDRRARPPRAPARAIAPRPARACPTMRRRPPTSRNASSMESPSTSGVVSRKIANTSRLAAE